MGNEVIDVEEEEETGNYYARCPDCDFLETDLPNKQARKLQKSGCPQCDDSRSVGVSTMDNL